MSNPPSQYKGDLPIFRIGERYGKLVIIAPSNRYKGEIYWVCRCDCGGTKILKNRYVCGGRFTSCGKCKKGYFRNHPEFQKEQKIGRLTLLFREIKGHKATAFWHCICECGKRTVSRECGLQDGTTQSCGCLAREKIVNKITKHGLSKHRLTNIHQGLMRRCNEPTNWAYSSYGARGIEVCEEWLAPAPEGFLNFYAWAISNGYREDLSIERLDVNGNYCPENCTWATSKQQGRNRRTTRRAIYKGKEEALLDLYERLPHYISYATVLRRIDKEGMDPIKAITTPNKNPKKKAKS